MNKIVLLLGILSLIGCSSTPKTTENYVIATPVAFENDDNIDESLVEAQERSLAKIKSQTSVEAQRVEKVKTDPVGLKAYEHQYQMDTKNHLPKVQKWIKYYSEKDRERFQRFINRGARYKQVIQDLLVTNGLPPDLYFLGILESGYVTKAKSHAGAVGPWQFMGPTGRQYGLKINNYVDERVDPIRSTIAAIKYLKELYRLKKSWYMALASYNAGPGRVNRAVRRGRTKDYWSLTRRRLLPYDTREYIPQFLAILSIGQNLEKYGFVERPDEVFAPRELVKVPSPVKLDLIAKKSKVDIKTITKFNPHLLKGMTPPTKSKVYHLWIPKIQSAQVALNYNQLLPHRIKGLKVKTRSSYYAQTRVHKVRRGQNLSTIARRYRTSISKIKKLNRLRSNRIYVGQRLKVRGRAKLFSRTKSRKPKVYRVRRGDNLTSISNKFGVKLSTLKRINSLKASKIFVGQKLKLTQSKRRVASKKSTKRYRIRKGDNLSKIARKFGISVKKLKRLNKLRSNKILRGQTLIVASK